MPATRRHFLRNSAILAAGSSLSLGRATGMAVATTATRSVAVPLSTDDQTVLGWVAQYSGSYRLQGGCVLGKIQGSLNQFTQISAYMSNPAKFATLLTQKSPFDGAFTSRDEYIFQSGATIFAVTNSATGLPAAVFPDWEHQAIQYDPTTSLLTDPLRDTGTGAQIDYTLKLVPKTRTPAQNFSALATGLFESALYKLTQNAAFNTFRTSVLNTRVSTAAIAATVNAVFLQNLAALSQVFPANSLGTILGSPLISTSLPFQFKLTAAQVLAKFTALRPKVDRSYSDEALWLAILLPAQTAPQKGDLTTALVLPANSGFNALLSLDGLNAARLLLQTPAFAS